MGKPKILISQRTDFQSLFFPQKTLDILMSFADVKKNEKNTVFTETEMSEAISDADGLIIGWGSTKLTKANIDAAKKLKIISLIGSSVKHLEPEYAMSKGITITNTAAGVGYSVAEFALTMILVLLHDLHIHHEDMRAGKWMTFKGYSLDLAGRKVGIIGAGTVGRFMINLLKPFGVEISVFDPYLPVEKTKQLGVNLVPLEELMKTCDIVTIHAGQTDETKHMLNKEKLEMLKDGAVLVNTARGSIIDEKALIEVLKKGKIKAGLDVFEVEALPADSELRKLPNVFLAPHRAGATKDTNIRNGIIAAEDMKLFFSGKEPKSKVTKEMLSRMT